MTEMLEYVPSFIRQTAKEFQGHVQASGYKKLSDYMNKECYRGKYGLHNIGDIVSLGDGGHQTGIVIGYNDSCNYNVYFWGKDSYSNVHPADIFPIKKEGLFVK